MMTGSGADKEALLGSALVAPVAAGQYVDVLESPAGVKLIARHVASLLKPAESPTNDEIDEPDAVAVGLAAFDAFLQVNVTGPILDRVTTVEQLFATAAQQLQTESSNAKGIVSIRKLALASLDVDGVSPYPYIPHIELFALARHIFCHEPSLKTQTFPVPSGDESSLVTNLTLSWARLRIHAWHYRLLTQPNLGPGSTFIKSSQWSDVPTLASLVVDLMGETSKQVLDQELWSQVQNFSTQDKVQLLLELTNYHIMLGRDDKARDTLNRAVREHAFVYALSGALGKRTKFQENNTSQLVVLAKSAHDPARNGDEHARPDALDLNDDTLLEKIAFSKDSNGQSEDKGKVELPAALADLGPDDQPQLAPLDQIILLAEATLKDSFSPVDSLTSEEVLPYAVRVIDDKPTNWQIYTQALLVRSRIESHRSRTVERAVLQMQAVVDQVIVDAAAAPEKQEEAAEMKDEDPEDESAESSIPFISVTGPDHGEPAPASAPAAVDKPVSFFRAPKPSDSAPAHVRLQYIHALASPPRWHLESELAYAWANVGSLVSALEIFKRLRLWPRWRSV